jgi:Potato inhibitor I family
MNKMEWPELVGMPGEEAVLIIQQENPSITDVQLVPHDAMVTMDYRTDRVRVFVNYDEQQTVARPPMIG